MTYAEKLRLAARYSLDVEQVATFLRLVAAEERRRGE